MPRYIRKTTPVIVTSDNADEAQYQLACSLYPVYTGSLYTEKHLNYTKTFFNTLTLNNNREDNDESDIVAKSDELGFYIYIENVQHESSYRRVSFDIVEYYNDQAHMESAENWLKTKNILNNTSDRVDTSVREPVHFHKPRRT